MRHKTIFINKCFPMPLLRKTAIGGNKSANIICISLL